jgi:hypothetical protein
MVLVAALASGATYAFGQSSGETPPYALLELASTPSVVMSGGLPDSDTLVKLGLNDNQAREVIALWGEAQSAVNTSGDQSSAGLKTADARDQIHQIVGDAEFNRISSFLEPSQEVAAGQWMGEGRTALANEPQSAKNS